MRFANLLKLGTLAWLLGTSAGDARISQPWTPEELGPKADLICNGTVVSVEDTGIKKDFIYPNITPSTHHEFVMKANIKVLHVFKGNAPTEIEFTYRISDPSAPEVNGAMHVELQKGSRYRFFLKPGDGPGQYVGVLDGSFDDNFDVEALWDNEPDDSKYLTNDEAFNIALDYAQSHKLEIKNQWNSNISCYPESSGAIWIVTFSSTGTLDPGSLQIVVRGGGSVDPDKVRVSDK